MNHEEIKRERRHQQALDRLGSNNPTCAHCGEIDWRCLEAHHIAGKAHDDLISVECRNCHRKLSDGQKDHPGQIKPKPELAERLAHVLLGLADFFELLITTFRDYASQLMAQASNDGGLCHD